MLHLHSSTVYYWYNGAADMRKGFEGLHGLVRDGESGLVVAPGDPVALAGAVNRLLEDRPLRERLGSAARRAVAPYTYEAMADGIGRALTAAGIP